jgi:hypothetical protein
VVGVGGRAKDAGVAFSAWLFALHALVLLLLLLGLFRHAVGLANLLVVNRRHVQPLAHLVGSQVAADSLYE